jgi:hypothetical protein
MAKTDLTAERVRELLDYNPDTGIFRWRIRPAVNVKPGDVAGSPGNRGYIKIQINKKVYAAHRLAWLYVYGANPLECIDHINRDKLDNRIANLREATVSENSINRVYNSRHLPGTTLRRGEWVAQIKILGRKICLGTFETEALAHAAYVSKKDEVHPRHPFT